MTGLRGGSGSTATEADALRGMFVARKEVFIDLLGWDLPVLAGQFEIDQFDNQHARYLVLTDPEGRHLASARLLPTTRPHILDTLFAELCEDPVPTGPDIFEITRFCLDRHQTTRERRDARNRLVSSLAITAIASGIRRYTGVAELNWARQVMDLGWRCTLLGKPRPVCGRLLTALLIEIDDHTMDGLASTGVYDPGRPVDVRHLATGGRHLQ